MGITLESGESHSPQSSVSSSTPITATSSGTFSPEERQPSRTWKPSMSLPAITPAGLRSDAEPALDELLILLERLAPSPCHDAS